jgi:hypothetical protein
LGGKQPDCFTLCYRFLRHAMCAFDEKLNMIISELAGCEDDARA